MTERTDTKKSVRKRRDNGDGSIYTRADGRFVGSLRLPNGKRKDFYGKTKQEVKEKLKKAQAQLEQGTLVTAKQVHTVLVSACKDAVKWKRIAVSPCESVSAPRQVRKDMKFFTVEQARHLLDAAQGYPLEAMIVLAVLSGARRGELFALHWDDINFRKGTVHIHRSLSYKNADGLGCVYKEELPKTAAGIRTIPLPDIALEVLKAHKARQLKQRLQCGDAWKNLDLVFCTGEGSYYSQSNHHTVFRKLLQAAGLPVIRFHDLRYSAATILLSMGVNPKVIQERLGHANITITLGRYSHVTESMQQEANNTLNQAFKRSVGE